MAMNDVATPTVNNTQPSPTGPEASSRVALLKGASRRFPLAQLVVLLAVFLWGSVQVDGFASSPSVRAMLVMGSLLALASLGQTFVILVGGLDLAVPGYVTVGAVAAAELGGTKGWPLWLVALVVVGVCAAAGGTCGAICHYLRVQSLVVTLGMSSVLIGGIIVITKASILGAPPASLSKWTFVLGETFGLPVPPVVFLTASVVVAPGSSWRGCRPVAASTRPGRTRARPKGS